MTTTPKNQYTEEQAFDIYVNDRMGAKRFFPDSADDTLQRAKLMTTMIPVPQQPTLIEARDYLESTYQASKKQQKETAKAINLPQQTATPGLAAKASMFGLFRRPAKQADAPKAAATPPKPKGPKGPGVS